MNNIIQYKVYAESVEFSEADGIFMVRSWGVSIIAGKIS